MKKLYKFLLILISIIGFSLSTAMLSLYYRIPFITDFIKEYEVIFPWFKYIYIGYCASICLCFAGILIFALFFYKTSSELILIKNKGKLYFSKQTIESAVRYSFSDVNGINFSKVKVIIGRRSEKVKIQVKLSLNDSTKMLELTETIQDKIESSLRSSLGIAADSVNVKVAELVPDKNLPKEEPEAVKDSRVI